MFFFFKQKTAYEMRISDWSSDVCSSDLAALDAETRLLVRGERHLRVERTMLVDPDAAAFEPRRDFRGGGDIAAPDRAAEREGRGVGARQDRKSGVAGKSGSGSVDPGGRRIIKKKKTRNRKNSST